MRQIFGNWNPDHPAIDMRDGQGRLLMTTARNVLPCIAGWMPVPSLTNFSTGTVLSGRCLGMFSARVSAGGYVIFVGTQTKLYKYNSGTGTFDDYTRTVGGNYNVPSGDYWSFTQFGSKVIACNINDDVQVIDVDTGAVNFSALGGTPPKARYVGVVGDFVILACLASNNRMIQNSAINDSAGWTVGTNLSDTQEFPDGDRVTGLTGGEYGWILQEHAIRKMIFQPGFDQAFRFERVERERGASSIYSAVGVRDNVFFLSYDGFYSFGPDGMNPIGHQRVNDWFQENSDPARFFSVIGFADLTGPRICWAFFNTPASVDFDRLLIYDWRLDRWSYCEVTAQFWQREVTAATTLEGLNVYGSIDPPAPSVPYSLDSPAFAGGLPVIGAITADGHLAFLQGTPMDALLLTCPIQLIEGQRANVSSVYPIGLWNDGTVSVRIGRVENTKNAFNYTGALAPSASSGIARCKASGRIHIIEVTITQSSGNSWEHAQGVDLTIQPDGNK